MTSREQDHRRAAEERRSTRHMTLPTVTAEKLRSLRADKMSWEELRRRFKRDIGTLKKIMASAGQGTDV